MPHRTCHTEISNKERNVKTHDGDDGGQVSQSKADSPNQWPLTASGVEEFRALLPTGSRDCHTHVELLQQTRPRQHHTLQ